MGWVAVGCISAVVLVAAITIAYLNLTADPAEDSLDPAQVERGASTYLANCASCHGATGEGHPGWRIRNPDGTFNAPPHDSSGHTWHHADGQLFNIVKNGGQVYASPGMTSRMPGFGGQLSDREIRDVIAYVKSFWGADELRYQSEVSRNDPMP